MHGTEKMLPMKFEILGLADYYISKFELIPNFVNLLV